MSEEKDVAVEEKRGLGVEDLERMYNRGYVKGAQSVHNKSRGRRFFTSVFTSIGIIATINTVFSFFDDD